MKKSVFILGILFAGSMVFTSCTKDLKNDVKNLKQEVQDLQDAVGSNEPITATTTFTDDNNATRTVTGTYKFKSSGYETQRMADNGDGTYDIRIERFSDVWGYDGAWVEFTYNPTTKAITNKDGGQYWDDADEYGDGARYNDSYPTGLTMNVTIDKFDVTTGDISMKFDASGTADYTNSVPGYYTPNSGKPMHTTFTFTGKLKLFKTN